MEEFIKWDATGIETVLLKQGALKETSENAIKFFDSFIWQIIVIGKSLQKSSRNSLENLKQNI